MALGEQRLSTASGLNEQPWGRDGLGSLVLHVAIFGGLLLSALIAAHIHGNAWGNHSETQGAIQATMVSSAPTIPLPQDQRPTKEVLATETPSPAPAPPQPKSLRAEAQDSIPVPVKQPEKTRLEAKRQVEQQKQLKVPLQRVPLVPAPIAEQHPQRAVYGAAAPAAVPQSMQQATPSKQVNVQGGNFGALYPWYVNLIKTRTAQNWYQQEVDPGTRVGSRVYITFSIHRDGSPSDVRVQQSSGSSTLDSSCLRAVERVESYGPLPSGYNGSSLLVQYYCEQPGR